MDVFGDNSLLLPVLLMDKNTAYRCFDCFYCHRPKGNTKKENAPRLCADNVMIKSKNIIARMLKRAIGTVSLSHLSRREKIESIEVERKLAASPKS
ncbi:hypothetical protein G7051_01780 [Dysgonomonas sp. HDW5B]|uniref:hypothetical protein n=1 Tax=Dysgonomonas sp. HDW5B TaxID=2714927 RepID=UPI001407B2B7|nr:hypothetical protein [Dysgonomonas sp. HDW5B]QIK53145.1 hypothetical protein G7051_01780 [Dysgonomonas sp. HDW5B]